MSSKSQNTPIINKLGGFSLIGKPLLDGHSPKFNITKKIFEYLMSGDAMVPPQVLQVLTEQDLIDKFGNDLIIPDGESWTIEVTDSFVLSIPFKIGDGSSLRVISIPINTKITYTGTGALFRNENPTNNIFALDVENINLEGDNTNSIFDIKAERLVGMDTVNTSFFKSIGVVESLFVGFQNSTMGDVQKGIIFKNTATIILTRFNVFNFVPSSPGLTFITIIATTNMQVTMTNCFGFDSNAIMVFFDPNSTTGTAFTIRDTSGLFAELFQIGSALAVTGVSDNGSGKSRYTTFADHLLVEGQAANFTQFDVETSYKGTQLITDVITSKIFDTDETFVGDDDGLVNAASLDATAVLVEAEDNVGSRDSMSQLEVRNNVTITMIPVGGTFVPIRKDLPVSNDFIIDPLTERFAGNTSTGFSTYNGKKTLPATVVYGFTIKKVSNGNSGTATATIFKNGIQVSKTNVTVMGYTNTISVRVSYIGSLFDIDPSDTFELRINNDNDNQLEITELTLLIV